MKIFYYMVILIFLLFFCMFLLQSENHSKCSNTIQFNNIEKQILYKAPSIPQYVSFKKGWKTNIHVKKKAKNELEILNWGLKELNTQAFYCFWTVKPQRKWIILLSDTGSGMYVLNGFVYLYDSNTEESGYPYQLIYIVDIGTFGDVSGMCGAYINSKLKTLIFHNSDGKTISSVKLVDFDKYTK